MMFGRMNGTLKHLREQLAHLPDAQRDYHGTLQMMRTAGLMLLSDINALIRIYEGDDAVVDGEYEDVPEVPEAAPLPIRAQKPSPDPPVRRGRGRPKLYPDAASRFTVRQRIAKVLEDATRYDPGDPLGATTATHIRTRLADGGLLLDLHQIEQHMFLMTRDGLTIAKSTTPQQWSLKS
jgi:hypothetical protein